MMERHSLKIACRDPEQLMKRVTKAPMKLITDPAQLRALKYREEGVIVPQLHKREPLAPQDLNALAAPLDTPDAVRLVKVPQRTEAFMRALKRSGLFSSNRGSVVTNGISSLTEAPPGLMTTSINHATGLYVAMHIDIHPHVLPEQMMMGKVCGSEPRGITFCPSITVDDLPEDLRNPTTPEERKERHRQTLQAVARLEDKTCYTLWLEGSGPWDATYEAYANFQPLRYLHDGTTFTAIGNAAVHLEHTAVIAPETFESVI